MAMVRWLVDLSFGSDALFSQALSVALPRVYRAAGWDLVTGDAGGGASAPPASPALGQLHTEVIAVIGRADYDRRTRTRLRSLADARFGSLLDGAAGRFLHGGHLRGCHPDQDIPAVLLAITDLDQIAHGDIGEGLLQDKFHGFRFTL